MGTEGPLVHIEAATLAGGTNNQDRYAYGDGWAFVLDGASSFSTTPPVHDGGWYADRLCVALSERLEVGPPSDLLAPIVADAIADAASAHDSERQGPCPSSTIALARWGAGTMRAYVLGDSFLAYKNSAGCHVITDDRIARVGDEDRLRYKDRLKAGAGFDFEHKKLLAQLQEAQRAARNRAGGYWIASDDPRAAYRARERSVSLDCVKALVVFTDGLTAVTPAEGVSRFILGGANINRVMKEQFAIEEGDSNGQSFARSKLHDDKTSVLVQFEGLR